MCELTSRREKADVLIIPSSCLSPTDSRDIHSNSSKYELDVRGSMHHSTIHAEIANKMQQYIRIYYSMFI